ncbi:hypothetical protein AGLY_004329 [Aphis glycines]|uniref:Uncharacterized protein n=1 Tax=Aphis glycines TaxID=307491 RepID=A0A6G0TY98_APHGL|nr:hypothetical protein AGLY_004329 [Aphis glycines]
MSISENFQKRVLIKSKVYTSISILLRNLSSYIYPNESTEKQFDVFVTFLLMTNVTQFFTVIPDNLLNVLTQLLFRVLFLEYSPLPIKNGLLSTPLTNKICKIKLEDRSLNNKSLFITDITDLMYDGCHIQMNIMLNKMIIIHVQVNSNMKIIQKLNKYLLKIFLYLFQYVIFWFLNIHLNFPIRWTLTLQLFEYIFKNTIPDESKNCKYDCFNVISINYCHTIPSIRFTYLHKTIKLSKIK